MDQLIAMAYRKRMVICLFLLYLCSSIFKMFICLRDLDILWLWKPNGLVFTTIEQNLPMGLVYAIIKRNSLINMYSPYNALQSIDFK